jgi:hypothetical protein
MASSNATTNIAAVSISTMKTSCAKYKLNRSVGATLASAVSIATLFEVISLKPGIRLAESPPPLAPRIARLDQAAAAEPRFVSE